MSHAGEKEKPEIERELPLLWDQFAINKKMEVQSAHKNRINKKEGEKMATAGGHNG